MCGRFVYIYKRKLKALVCTACLLFVVNILYQLNSIDNTLHKLQPRTRKWTRSRSPPCNTFTIRQKLCKDYMNQRIGGNICNDLCIKDHIDLEPLCKSHKDTTFIIFGKWKDKDIVLKTKESSHSHQNNLDSELSYAFQGQDKFLQVKEQYQKGFINHIYNHIISEVNYENLRNIVTPSQMLDIMCHPHPPKNLSHSDMQSLWLLAQQEEFLKFQLLQNTTHIPRVYGFCGTYYAVERVQTLESLFHVFKRPPSWPTRVHIAVELLRLVRELKSTSIGHLSLCDVHPGNFGVAKDGRIVALDVDTAFTDPQMEMFMGQGNCSSDQDCTFFDCMSVCNILSGECTSNILTNNLHNICKDLLVSVWRNLPGILNIPFAYRQANNELTTYLNECAMEMKFPWQPQKEQRLHKQIYNLLMKA